MNESETDKKLSEILETEYEVIPVEEEESTEVVEYVEENNLPVVANNNRDVEYDYEFSRTTHRDLIEQGQDALDGILKVAKESQHPRAYEVAANLLKNMSDMTDKLMALQEKKRALTGAPKGEAAPQINIDKAVFTGSTADLLKRIRKD